MERGERRQNLASSSKIWNRFQDGRATLVTSNSTHALKCTFPSREGRAIGALTSIAFTFPNYIVPSHKLAADYFTAEDITRVPCAHVAFFPFLVPGNYSQLPFKSPSARHSLSQNGIYSLCLAPPAVYEARLCHWEPALLFRSICGEEMSAWLSMRRGSAEHRKARPLLG